MAFAKINGAGLGLRRSLIPQLQKDGATNGIDFFELAPENWIGLGGRYSERLRWFSERFPLVSHGLSLNLGGQDPLDMALLANIKEFLTTHQVRYYTEHLSFCGHGGHLYDLLPIPFTQEAVRHVAERIAIVQDVLGQQIAVENVSYYLAPSNEMSEIDFINAVLKEADCQLLLDINNIYVNSVNHGYDAHDFIREIPAERIAYAHIAGHVRESKDLCVDTHGADVIDDVWQLADYCYQQFGAIPTLLERDFNLPPLASLHSELQRIKQGQGLAQATNAKVVKCEL